MCDENFDVWMDELKEAIANCQSGSSTTDELRRAAEDLAFAPKGDSRTNALARVGHETRKYFTRVAASRFEEFRKQPDEVRG